MVGSRRPGWFSGLVRRLPGGATVPRAGAAAPPPRADVTGLPYRSVAPPRARTTAVVAGLAQTGRDTHAAVFALFQGCGASAGRPRTGPACPVIRPHPGT